MDDRSHYFVGMNHTENSFDGHLTLFNLMNSLLRITISRRKSEVPEPEVEIISSPFNWARLNN